MSDTNAKITISAQDLASDVMVRTGQTMQSAVGDVASGVTETAHELRDGLTEGFENPMGALQNLGAEIEHSLGPLGAIAGVGVAAVAGLSAVVMELGEHGAEVNDVADGFTRFAGSAESATTILDAMRDGVQGTISDFALETDALHLMSAGVRLTADDFNTLSQASLVLAHEGFGDTKTILDELTQSMITGRTRTLERMTGVIDATAAESDYAASLGVNTNELDKAGQAEAKRQAILEQLRQVVADAGEQELSFKDQIAQMHTAMTNANDALGVAVATSPVLRELLGSVGGALTEAFGADQVSTIQTLVHWIDQGAITLVGMAEAGLTGAKVLNDAFYGTREILSNIEGAVVSVAQDFV